MIFHEQSDLYICCGSRISESNECPEDKTGSRTTGICNPRPLSDHLAMLNRKVAVLERELMRERDDSKHYRQLYFDANTHLRILTGKDTKPENKS